MLEFYAFSDILGLCLFVVDIYSGFSRVCFCLLRLSAVRKQVGVQLSFVHEALTGRLMVIQIAMCTR